MNHQDILNTYLAIRISTACAIIGGDGDPVSDDTIYRLIRNGQLVRAGKGKVTTASVRAHLEELCHVEKKAPAVSTKRKTGAGLRSVRLAAGTASDAMSGLDRAQSELSVISLLNYEPLTVIV